MAHLFSTRPIPYRKNDNTMSKRCVFWNDDMRRQGMVGGLGNLEIGKLNEKKSLWVSS